MPNQIKLNLLSEIKSRFGEVKKLPNSQSLFEIGEGVCRVYTRYSKIHNRNQAFYGIRKEDLKQLEGFNSFICFLYPSQKEPIFVPYIDFEEILNSLEPSSDGQIKASIFLHEDSKELYISNVGRFNIEGYMGWNYLLDSFDMPEVNYSFELNHSQIQTILGSIGTIKGFDVWIPSFDRNKLDWNHGFKFESVKELPSRYDKINQVIKEIDIIWLKRGSGQVDALFEVEHSTPIYSGLLRFNDLHIIEPSLKPKYSIVSNVTRRDLFVRQISRPTFKVSGLIERCSFLNYKDVYTWHKRISKDLK